MTCATSYDVVVAGGSIAGLLCAREIATAGHTVLVVEEDYEIGTPEHCGGLVSSTGLRELGIIPFGNTLMHQIKKARITTPDGAHSITIDAKKQNVIGVNRRDLDKQIAHQAQKNGAEIITRTSMQEITDEGVRIIKDGNNKDVIKCNIIVDARGVSSLIQKDRTGMIPSGQYEVYADWIENDTVEVVPDQQNYPGFFAWIIPSGRGRGRIGVAGKKINVVNALEAFLAKKSPNKKGYSIVRKIFAPIWINGPIKEFYKGRMLIVGDAAGQAKPTTAGGIFSSGMGGILAGCTISQYLNGVIRNTDELGKIYQKKWRDKFGREFDKQMLARKILERADNIAITNMIKMISPETLQEISKNDDFDFHVSAIFKLFGAVGTAKTAQSMIASELRRIVKNKKQEYQDKGINDV